jgi:hypothetical protein
MSIPEQPTGSELKLYESGSYFKNIEVFKTSNKIVCHLENCNNQRLVIPWDDICKFLKIGGAYYHEKLDRYTKYAAVQTKESIIRCKIWLWFLQNNEPDYIEYLKLKKRFEG